MRVFKLFLIIFALSVVAFADSLPDQWAGVTVYYNQFASPQVNGAVTYAKRILTNGTYSYNSVHILSVQKNPWRAMTETETGIAQHITKFGPFDVFGLGQIGVATSGSEDGTKVGPSFSAGGFAFAGVGRGVTLGPTLRLTKSTIGDRQWALGLTLGWGK